MKAARLLSEKNEAKIIQRHYHDNETDSITVWKKLMIFNPRNKAEGTQGVVSREIKQISADMARLISVI